MHQARDVAWLAGHRVSLIIPTLNEAANIPHVFARLPAWVHEVIIVDGGSTDGTLEQARIAWPNRHVVVQERRRQVGGEPGLHGERRGNGVTLRLVSQDRRGKGNAIQTGLLVATGDIVVLLDADGSTDPTEIPAFVGALLAGADFVKGTRFAQGAGTGDMSLVRVFGNWALLTLTNLLFGTRYTDITYGYNALWRSNIGVLAWDIDGWAHEIINNIRVARHGLKVVEVACFERPRYAGEAKLRAMSAGWTILKAIVGERLRSLPARLIFTAPGGQTTVTDYTRLPVRSDPDQLVGVASRGAERVSAGIE